MEGDRLAKIGGFIGGGGGPALDHARKTSANTATTNVLMRTLIDMQPRRPTENLGSTWATA